MKILIRSFAFTFIGFLLCIAILNFTMLDTRENEILYATNNAITQTQIIITEIKQDKELRTENSRIADIKAREIESLLGVQLDEYYRNQNAYKYLTKDATNTERNNFYKNLFLRFFKAQVTSDSIFDVTFNALSFEDGIIDVTVESTFFPILYTGSSCKYAGTAPGCKTVNIHRTSIIDTLVQQKN